MLCLVFPSIEQKCVIMNFHIFRKLVIYDIQQKYAYSSQSHLIEKTRDIPLTFPEKMGFGFYRSFYYIYVAICIVITQIHILLKHV